MSTAPATHPLRELQDLQTFRAFVVGDRTSIPRLLLCINSKPGQSLSPASAAAVRCVQSVAAATFSPKSSGAASSPSLLSSSSAAQQQPIGRTTSTSSTAAVECAVWYCGDFTDAKATLAISDATDASLLVLLHGDLADRLDGAQAIVDSFPTMAEKIAKYATPGIASVASNGGNVQVGGGGGTAAAPAPPQLEVNVTKLLLMGKDLMRKAQPQYAEKFFNKAVGVLDAVTPEAAGSSELQGSLAMCLGWLLLARLVTTASDSSSSSSSGSIDAVAKRLQAEPLCAFSDEPLSDACRALTVANLIRYAPAKWESASCSVAKLSEALKNDANDHNKRAMMLITLFLSGDLERCITEALKLHVLGVDYGRVVMNELVTFLGGDHELIKRSGWRVQ